MGDPYFHGGNRKLHVGDYILPLSETGVTGVVNPSIDETACTHRDQAAWLPPWRAATVLWNTNPRKFGSCIICAKMRRLSCVQLAISAVVVAYGLAQPLSPRPRRTRRRPQHRTRPPSNRALKRKRTLQKWPRRSRCTVKTTTGMSRTTPGARVIIISGPGKGRRLPEAARRPARDLRGV